MKTIVVSGITLRKGGTLKILREALRYLSKMAESGEWRVVALVNRRELCDYPNIEYIEVPLKGWIGRLWYEYVTMHRISLEMTPVHLWLSMHDVTPRVKAERQAVYCQTSFPFYRWKWRDFRFDPKIPMFAMLTRFYYKARVHHNRYLIVQQEWLRKGLSKMLGVGEEKFIVAQPERAKGEGQKMKDEGLKTNEVPLFLYVSTADCHKNFETLCEASRLLEEEMGKGRFRTIITVRGNENKYAKWLYAQWGDVQCIDFHGLMGKEELYDYYAKADCLVFPSNIETWGLPITEYMEAHGGPMILTDLPYARGTASGSSCTTFFEQDNVRQLKERMKELLEGNMDHFHAIPAAGKLGEPSAANWKELFEILLQ